MKLRTPQKNNRNGITDMQILNRPLIHVASIVFAIILIYSNILTAPFVLDDVGNIIENQAIRSLQNFIDTSSFDTIEINEDLRPLLTSRYVGYVSFAANYAVHKLDVRGYHVVNILIHIFNSLLVYTMLHYTFRTPRFQNCNALECSADSKNHVALFTALLFAVHPIQTQAVTYIVQRFASLAALFYLLSLVFYIRFRLDESTKSYRRYVNYVFSVTSVILAMKTKEFALMLPVMVVLYEFIFFSGDIKKRIMHLIPYVLTISIIPLGLINVSAAKLSGASGQITWDAYLITQFRVVITYVRLLIFPVNQNVDYDYPRYQSFLALEVLLSFFCLLLILAVGIWLYRISCDQERKNNCWYCLAACGVFWFFITIAPESSVIPIKDVIFEHRMYLPSIGFFLSATILIERMFLYLNIRFSLALARNALLLPMVVLVAVFSATTYVRNNVWKDSVRLWEDTTNKSPGNLRAKYNLGCAYTEKGRYNDAILVYREIMRINPTFSSYVYDNLGAAYMALGQVEEANSVYAYAANLATYYGNIRFNRGNEYMAQGRADLAISEYKIAIGLKPDNAEYHLSLGDAYAGDNNLVEARKEFRAALSLKPDLTAAQQQLLKYAEK